MVRLEQQSNGQVVVTTTTEVTKPNTPKPSACTSKCDTKFQQAKKNALDTKNDSIKDANSDWAACCSRATGQVSSGGCGVKGTDGKPCLSLTPNPVPQLPLPPGCCCLDAGVVKNNSPMSCGRNAIIDAIRINNKYLEDMGRANADRCSCYKACKAPCPAIDDTPWTPPVASSGIADSGGTKPKPVTNLTTINNLDKTDYLNIGLEIYSALIKGLQETQNDIQTVNTVSKLDLDLFK